MMCNESAAIFWLKNKRQLWEIEFDGAEVKSIKPIDPKYVVKEVKL